MIKLVRHSTYGYTWLCCIFAASKEKMIDMDLFSSKVKEHGKFTFANISFLIPNVLIGIKFSR